MTKFTTILASTAAAVLLTGNAFAAGPLAGEGPQFSLFDAAPMAGRAVQRTQVQMDAARQPPVSGERSAWAMSGQPSGKSRAEVAQTTREAIARGFVIKSGDKS